MDVITPQQRFQNLLKNIPHYESGAYQIAFDAMGFAIKKKYRCQKCDMGRHVSVQEFCDSLKDYAIDEFGCLAGTVFKQLNLTETKHLGDLVYNLVEYKLMKISENDRKDDFEDCYNGLSVIQALSVNPVFKFPEDKINLDIDYKRDFESL